MSFKDGAYKIWADKLGHPSTRLTPAERAKRAAERAVVEARKAARKQRKAEKEAAERDRRKALEADPVRVENRERAKLYGGRMSNYMEAACPTCGAHEADPCMTPDGRKAKAPHRTRVKAGLSLERGPGPVEEKPIIIDERTLWS